MMLVDDQSGSKDLFPYLQALTQNVLLTRIYPPFGDMCWVGNGPDGKDARVGVEYKKITEVLDNIAGGDRFVAHQVDGMLLHYDRRYLVIEGRVRVDRTTGILQELRRDRWQDIQRGGRSFMGRDLEHWITTIDEQAQFRTRVTYDEYESARWIFNRYTWWTAKGWDDHTSLKQFYVSPPPTAMLIKPKLVMRSAKELPKIGWEKALAVSRRFGSVREMANANEQTWAEIDGIGAGISRMVVDAITGKLDM